MDAPALHTVRADPSAFAEHLTNPAQLASTFPNLGGDATLVAPSCQPDRQQHCAHLLAFLRAAQPAAAAAWWAALGSALTERLKQTTPTTPIWVSTSGLGVPWLSVCQHASCLNSARERLCGLRISSLA